MESLGLCCVLPLHCDSFCRISPTDGVLMDDGNFTSKHQKKCLMERWGSLCQPEGRCYRRVT